ncbi:MAG TPA: YbaK/EbsC family protein [Bacillota bacterium]|nr:YbaK/EbsC family protein [Bacillota bacterium]
MHPNAERVQAALAAGGSAARVTELAERTGTAEEAARAVGADVAAIAKSLVFLAGEQPVLVIASGAHRVSEAKLATSAGAPIRRVDADAVATLTGFPVGGVPPLGHERPIRTLFDRDLLTHPLIWAAAGTPNALFAIAPRELVRLVGAEVTDVGAT